MKERAPHIGHLIGVMAALVVLGGCAAQQRSAVRQSWTTIVVPGATGVTVEESGTSAWRISYQAPDTPTSWYVLLAQQLEARGWTSADQTAYAPLNRSYSRATSLGVATVWEWVWFSARYHWCQCTSDGAGTPSRAISVLRREAQDIKADRLTVT